MQGTKVDENCYCRTAFQKEAKNNQDSKSRLLSASWLLFCQLLIANWIVAKRRRNENKTEKAFSHTKGCAIYDMKQKSYMAWSSTNKQDWLTILVWKCLYQVRNLILCYVILSICMVLIALSIPLGFSICAFCKTWGLKFSLTGYPIVFNRWKSRPLSRHS